jgi:hypothetical protein
MPIRRSPRPKVQFTIVANQVIENPHLSWRARGLLVYLLSRPDDWECRTEHLARISKDGIHTVRSILRELEDARYLTRTRYQDAAGHWRIWTNVYDTPRVEDPVDKLGDNPSPHAEFPDEERPRIYKELTSTKDLEKELLPTQVETPLVCGECAGSGWTPNQADHLVKCDECSGAGLIRWWER